MAEAEERPRDVEGPEEGGGEGRRRGRGEGGARVRVQPRREGREAGVVVPHPRRQPHLQHLRKHADARRRVASM